MEIQTLGSESETKGNHLRISCRLSSPTLLSLIRPHGRFVLSDTLREIRRAGMLTGSVVVRMMISRERSSQIMFVSETEKTQISNTQLTYWSCSQIEITKHFNQYLVKWHMKICCRNVTPDRREKKNHPHLSSYWEEEAFEPNQYAVESSNIPVYERAWPFGFN